MHAFSDSHTTFHVIDPRRLVADFPKTAAIAPPCSPHRKQFGPARNIFSVAGLVKGNDQNLWMALGGVR